MFLNILFAIFVTSFVSIVVLGHVLLITAIWPNFKAKRHERHFGAVHNDLPLVH